MTERGYWAVYSKPRKGRSKWSHRGELRNFDNAYQLAGRWVQFGHKAGLKHFFYKGTVALEMTEDPEIIVLGLPLETVDIPF
jgi:hypothetical protein